MAEGSVLQRIRAWARRSLNWHKIKAFLIQQHLPLGLAFFTVFGYLVPWPGAALAKTPLNTVSIVGIFFISGLQLQTEEVKKAVKAYVAYLFGFASILGISPCLSFWIAGWDLGPVEFAQGMALFFAMPTTISSGVLMTGEAKGNVSLSLLLSVATNLIGVVTAPFFLSVFLTPSGTDTGLDPVELLWKLTLTILLPLLIGKALRYFTRVVAFVKAWKLQLKFVSSGLLIMVPWMSISAAAGLLRDTPAGYVFALIGIGSGLHLMLLVFNYTVCTLIAWQWPAKLRLPERKSVVINASQKTVNTAVSVIAYIPLTLGDKGLLTLPCILAHLSQIIIDAFIVAQWRKVREEGEVRSSDTTGSAASGAPAAATEGGAAVTATGIGGEEVLIVGSSGVSSPAAVQPELAVGTAGLPSAAASGSAATTAATAAATDGTDSSTGPLFSPAHHTRSGSRAGSGTALERVRIASNAGDSGS